MSASSTNGNKTNGNAEEKGFENFLKSDFDRNIAKGTDAPLISSVFSFADETLTNSSSNPSPEDDAFETPVCESASTQNFSDTIPLDTIQDSPPATPSPPLSLQLANEYTAPHLVQSVEQTSIQNSAHSPIHPTNTISSPSASVITNNSDGNGVRREAATTTVVYLALGSNLGDRLTNLREAIVRLERHPGFTVEAKSRVYETESVEGGGETSYLNAVIRGTWTGSAMSLLRCVQGVEERMGRPRPPRQGPRTIDVDILLFGDSTIENAHLVVPHPRMMHRAFVLRPLCDVLENGWIREFARGNL